MIKFGSFYFAADQIAAIIRDKSSDAQFPERLVISLKNGQSYSMNYRHVEAVERDMGNISRQIDREQSDRLDRIKDDVSLLLYYIKSLEKRQLRILRILKKLPSTSAEEIDAAMESEG